MTIYDWSKVPAKLWAELGHELCAADRWSDMRLELLRAVQAVQAAAETRVPLRTRADVDAELGRLCRQYFGGDLASQQSLLSIHERLKVVSHEPTAPETYGPRSVDDRGSSPGRDPATGATSSDPRPKCIRCGRPWTPAEGEDATEHPCLNCDAVRLMHGKPPERAAPDLPDPEPCGCEEAEVLKAEIAILRAKISDCANHAQGGLGSEKFPSCMAETACRWIYQRLTTP